MDKLCYFNGEIMALKDARLSPNDLGVLRGYGIFDYLRTYNGIPFLLDQHLDRLYNSLDSMGLVIPDTRSDIKSAINELMQRSPLEDAGFRLVVTGGESPDGFSITKFLYWLKNHPNIENENEDSAAIKLFSFREKND